MWAGKELIRFCYAAIDPQKLAAKSAPPPKIIGGKNSKESGHLDTFQTDVARFAKSLRFA
jgi:hypothetical protein